MSAAFVLIAIQNSKISNWLKFTKKCDYIFLKLLCDTSDIVRLFVITGAAFKCMTCPGPEILRGRSRIEDCLRMLRIE